jgi:hypothetical protein
MGLFSIRIFCLLNLFCDSAVPDINGNVWPKYGLNRDNSIDIKYVEFNSKDERMGKIHDNGYDGLDERHFPSLINNCINYWDKIISEQF